MLDESLFVSSTIHNRKVKLGDGTEHTLYFRELPAITFRKFHDAERSDDEDVRSTAMHKLIVDGLCEPDGKPAITLEKAMQLKTAPARAIFDQILDVNGFGKNNKGKS